jgi:hypothetical protein
MRVNHLKERWFCVSDRSAGAVRTPGFSTSVHNLRREHRAGADGKSSLVPATCWLGIWITVRVHRGEVRRALIAQWPVASGQAGRNFMIEIRLTSLQARSYVPGIRSWHWLCRGYNVAIFGSSHVWKQQNKMNMNVPTSPSTPVAPASPTSAPAPQACLATATPPTPAVAPPKPAVQPKPAVPPTPPAPQAVSSGPAATAAQVSGSASQQKLLVQQSPVGKVKPRKFRVR